MHFRVVGLCLILLFNVQLFLGQNLWMKYESEDKKLNLLADSLTELSYIKKITPQQTDLIFSNCSDYNTNKPDEKLLHSMLMARIYLIQGETNKSLDI